MFDLLTLINNIITIVFNNFLNNETFWTAIGSIGTLVALIFTCKKIFEQNKENVKARKFELEKEIE